MDVLKSYLINNHVHFIGRRRFEKPTIFLLLVFIAVFSLLFVSCVFHIDRVVRVEGRVIPTGRSRPIQHLEGGIVSAIHTFEGAVVHKGDLLVSIDATTAGVTLNENSIKLASEKARTARLKAEATGVKMISFSNEIKDKRVLDAELNLFKSRQERLFSEEKVYVETINQGQAALVESKNRKKSLVAELALANERVSMISKMVDRRAASKMDLLEAQSRASRLETEVNEASNAIPRILASLGADQARLDSLRANFQSTAQKELVDSLAESERLEQMLTAANDRLNRTEIVAPIDGTINRLSVSSIGSVVRPGESIIELTPVSDEIMIEAQINPKDRGELIPGIISKIRVSAYDHASLGVLSGVLKELSADTMLDSRGNAYYRARLTVDALPNAYKNKPILPGMTVISDLVIGQRTILSHLLSPLSKFTQNMFRDSK